MKYYTANHKEYKGSPWVGAYYDITGKVRYMFKDGKLVDVATTNSKLDTVIPLFTKYTSILNNKSNTKVSDGSQSYDVYSANGAYFYKSGDSYIPITNTTVISSLKNNKAQTIDLNPQTTVTKPSESTTNTNTTTNTTPSTNNNSSTSGSSSTYNAYYDNIINEIRKEYDEQTEIIKGLTDKIYELENPKVMSAEEAAEHFGIDYNYDNILKDYNEQTNAYYGSAIDEQEDLRTQYLRNNAQYFDNLVDAYIDSYANAAPTATGKGALAANALTTQLNANKTNAANDYGMLQSVNNLEKARDAELAGNPYLAKEYYNNIGTYLSTLTANKNTYDVKQYVDQLDAYSSMYASARATQAAAAQANAAKYSGLANAGVYNAASNASNSTTSWDTLYNFYRKALGDDTLASKYVTNLAGSSFNAGTNK